MSDKYPAYVKETVTYERIDYKNQTILIGNHFSITDSYWHLYILEKLGKNEGVN